MPWLTTLAVLALAQEPGFGGAPGAPADEAAPVDDSPGQAELRARLNTTLGANATGSGASAMPPTRRTKLEEELEDLLAAGARPERVRAAEERVATLHDMSDLVERIALARLSSCTRALGHPIVVKTWRMTAGGPVALSAKEMVEQVPNGDPEGCERVTLVDADTVAKARRLFALRSELATRTFGYFDVAERKRLEGERADLERTLQQQAVAGVVVANPPR